MIELRTPALTAKMMSPPSNELHAITQDRELSTPEIFTPNDFYGHATILKRYAGVDPLSSLKASIEHGLFFGDFAWDVELSCPLPMVLTSSQIRIRTLRKRTPKALIAVGPMILYAPHALDAEKLESERQRLGRSLLVMPSHSTHFITAEYDIENYCGYLEKIGKEFDSVRVCLYWKDVLLGRDIPYRKRGFECVSAGHMFDPMFLPRLKSLISLAAIVTSNVSGSHVGLCVALNRPHVIAYQQPKRVSAESSEAITRDFNKAGCSSPEYLEIENAFSEWTDDISPRQQELVTRYWGLDEKRSPEEMKLILLVAEDMYQQKLAGISSNDWMRQQADRYRAAGNYQTSEYLNSLHRRYPVE